MSAALAADESQWTIETKEKSKINETERKNSTGPFAVSNDSETSMMSESMASESTAMGEI